MDERRPVSAETARATAAGTRAPLSRTRVLEAAVDLADREGLAAVTMRRLAAELAVEAMSLYHHVANKEALLDGVADVVVGEINETVGRLDGPAPGHDWRGALRARILASRTVMLRHRWAPRVVETRTTLSPTVVGYFDGLLGILVEGGFSYDLAHHTLHALGSRALGFTQELFDPAGAGEETGSGGSGGGSGADGDAAATAQELAQAMAQFPHIAAMLAQTQHDDDALGWCDDQVEFEFGLDVILDGLERRRGSG